MSLKNIDLNVIDPFAEEDFVGRTTARSFVNEDIVNFSQNNTTITQLASGQGNTFSLADVIPPINLNEGWNIFGYTLPYSFDCPKMMVSIFEPLLFSVPELADRILDNPQNNAFDGISNTSILFLSSRKFDEGTLSNFLFENHLSIYNKFVDKTIFDILRENIVVAKNNDGAALMPNFNFNGIGDLIPGEAYQIKMINAFSNAKFFALGANNFGINNENDYINIQNSQVQNFSSGWKFMGYNRRRTGVNVKNFFEDQGIASDIELIKDNGGDIYWPEFGFNSIGEFIPGAGYQIKLNNNVSFQYPPDDPISEASLIEDIEGDIITNSSVEDDLLH